jgi:ATP-dependent DNA helicase RecQ
MHAKESTYDETFRLHKSGLTIEEIAQKRDLRPTTIEGHLAKGIGSGEVEISTLLDANGLERIKTAFAEQDDNSLSRIHAGLKGKYSFGQLRMVKAYLMKSVNAEEK